MSIKYCSTVSLNGLDNVGKTTAMYLLPSVVAQLHDGIHQYDDYMKGLVMEDKLKAWWFTCSNEEFVITIMRAINQRASIPSTKTFIVYNRGGAMIESVCIATIATKEKCDLQQAQSIYESIKIKLEIKVPDENIRILLKHRQNLEESALMCDKQSDKVYVRYHKLLQQLLAIQESAMVYTHVININNMSIIEVQNEIRSILHTCSLHNHSSAHLMPMFEHTQMIIAFGEISESDNSLVKGTCKKFDIIGVSCTHLKIHYLMELVSAEIGSDAYLLPEKKQAIFLVKHLNCYLKHHCNRIAIIESLYCRSTTQELKLIFGNLLHIIYIKTTLDNSHCCSSEDPQQVKTKDEMKVTHGGEQITDCFVLNNNNLTLDESINIIYEWIKSKNEKIALQALLSNQYLGNIDLFSNQFVLCAGSVLIHKSLHQVCLIRCVNSGEWLLPKGRQNIHETLQTTAIRETYEETGYHCTLMLLTMETRATPKDGMVYGDISRKMNNVCEPFVVSLRRIGGSANNQKLIFWFITQIDEDKPREMNTQMMNENFESKLVSLQEANSLLSFDQDKVLVNKAFEIVYGVE